MKNAAHAKTDLIEREGREDRVSFHWLFFSFYVSQSNMLETAHFWRAQTTPDQQI